MNQLKAESKISFDNAELVAKVREWVRKLAMSGGKDWTLEVPVNFDKDPDVLIEELCKRLESAPAAALPVPEFLSDEEISKVNTGRYISDPNPLPVQQEAGNVETIAIVSWENEKKYLMDCNDYRHAFIAGYNAATPATVHLNSDNISIDLLLSEFKRQGIDTTNWDGEEGAEKAIVDGVRNIVQHAFNVGYNNGGLDTGLTALEYFNKASGKQTKPSNR